MAALADAVGAEITSFPLEDDFVFGDVAYEWEVPNNFVSIGLEPK